MTASELTKLAARVEAGEACVEAIILLGIQAIASVRYGASDERDQIIDQFSKDARALAAQQQDRQTKGASDAEV